MIAPHRTADTRAELAQCPSCLQLYAYELEYRCSDCDDPVCPVCAVRRSETWLCSACAMST